MFLVSGIISSLKRASVTVRLFFFYLAFTTLASFSLLILEVS
jgi:hypothetical protein